LLVQFFFLFGEGEMEVLEYPSVEDLEECGG